MQTELSKPASYKPYKSDFSTEGFSGIDPFTDVEGLLINLQMYANGTLQQLGELGAPAELVAKVDALHDSLLNFAIK